MRQAPPTALAADRSGRLVPLVGLGLAGFAPGPYELLLHMRDELAGQALERRERFDLDGTAVR